MKIITFFSKSHTCLYKRFMNTFPYDKDIDLVVRYMPQECDGNYDTWNENWMKTMYRKVQYIIDYLDEIKEGELLIHADIDIVFYRSFVKDLEKLMNDSGNDIMFQNDGSTLCMGFFVVRKSDHIVKLFNDLYERMGDYEHDQDAMNNILPFSGIQYDKLPERYFSYGPLNGLKRWTVDCTHVNVPDDIVMHHANWTVGIDNKLKLIQQVKDIIIERDL